MHPNIALLIAVVSRNPGVQFAKFLYETVDSGEVAELLVTLGASTEELYLRDLVVLGELYKRTSGQERIAVQELMDSRQESLSYGIGTNDLYTQKNYWIYPQGMEQYGIRFHKDDGRFQITCLLQQKLVHIPGTYKTVNHRPFTVIKNKIRAQLPSHKFRTYRLDHVAGIRANGTTLEFDNVISRSI